MQYMLSANQGHNVGWIKIMLLICGGGSWIELSETGARVTADIDRREDIRLREQQPELSRIPLARALRCKEVELVGVSHPQFVDGAGADIPYIGNLCVVAVDVAYVAVKGAAQRTRVGGRIVTLCNGSGQAVVRTKLVIEASEIFLERLRTANRIVVVVARDAGGCVGCARNVRQRKKGLEIRRYRVDRWNLVTCELCSLEVGLTIRSGGGRSCSWVVDGCQGREV